MPNLQLDNLKLSFHDRGVGHGANVPRSNHNHHNLDLNLNSQTLQTYSSETAGNHPSNATCYATKELSELLKV